MGQDNLNSPIVERIQRESGIPELLEVLAERIDPTDLQSLLLEVYRHRAARITPAQLLDRWEHDRFVRPSGLLPSRLAELELLAWALLPDPYEPIELSPVCPLGTNAAIATVDQNKVVTTIRNTEVVADSTNVLALECAARRRRLLRDDARSRERVRLAASHRLVRGQAYRSASAVPHFRLLGLCSAGRDEGSFRFETASLLEQIGFFVRLIQESTSHGYQIRALRVALTDLTAARYQSADEFRLARLRHGVADPTATRQQILHEHVLTPLESDFPAVACGFNPERESGRGYYVGACFNVYATNEAGDEFELADGGFTTWTQQLLSNKKERLLISGLGTELFCGRFHVSAREST
jgi:hypothetical protein